MTESILELLNRSERSIDAAKLLLGDGYPDFAVSRSYYAMFYALQALMLDRNLAYSKHSGIIGAFGREFVKTGLFDSRFHRYVLNAFDLRNIGDYGSSQAVSEEKAARTVANAIELLGEIKRYLANNGHE